MIKDALDLKVVINEYSGVFIDRSLNSQRARQMLGYQPPTWEEMVERLSKEIEEYEAWRK